MTVKRTAFKNMWIPIAGLIIGITIGIISLEMIMSFGFNRSIITSTLSYMSLITQEHNLIIKYARTGILVELSTKSFHIAQLHAMLYPSWLYINSLSHLPIHKLIKHPQIQLDNTEITSVKLDLIIFCEPAACNNLPIGCYPLSELHDMHNTLNKLQFKQMDSTCFYHNLDDQYEARSIHKTVQKTANQTGYQFLPSLLFLIEQPCISIINYYDYILRMDVDTFMTPLSLVYIPNSHDISLAGAFGDNFMGTEFTNARLEKVSKQLNLRHAGLHGMQSTWYVQSNKFLDIAKYAINLTIHFYRNEFSDKICINIKKYTNGEIECKWADWYQPVSSLYGSNLAINHVLYDDIISYKDKYNIDVNEWKTIKLDCWNDNQLIIDTVQLHVVIYKHDILKRIALLRDMQQLSNLCSNYQPIKLRQFQPIEEAVTAFEYASRIVGHSLRDVCATIMVPFVGS
eukprot:257226_1